MGPVWEDGFTQLLRGPVSLRIIRDPAMMGEQMDQFLQMLCRTHRCDPIVYLHPSLPSGQIPGLLKNYWKPKVQVTRHIKPQVVMISGPLRHTSPRLSHLMSLLELRHVKPDEALNGNKVCQCERGGKGRAQARPLNYPRPSDVPHYQTPHFP